MTDYGRWTAAVLLFVTMVLPVGLGGASWPADKADSESPPTSIVSPAAPMKNRTIDVLDFGATADGTHDDAPALCAAIMAAAAGDSKAVLVPRRITLRSHVGQRSCSGASAANPLTFVVPRGGGFNVATGNLDLVLHGDLVAGPYQVFFGEPARFTGTTLFGAGSVWPEWWGARGDGIKDDSRAIAQAIQLTTGEVLFRPVTYLVAGSAGADLFGFQAKRMRGQRYGGTGGTVIRVSSESAVLGSVFRALTHKVELRDLMIDANGRAAHGVLLNGSHNSILDNVTVARATSHGFMFKWSMNAAWTNLSSISNGGDGFRIEDSNASRLVAASTTLNGGFGISVRSTFPGARSASAGVTIIAPDVEVDGAGGIEIVNTTSVSTLINPWIEAGATGDAMRLEGAKHVTVLGGRFTGIGNGTNRAIRIMNGSSGVSLFNVRLRAGGGERNYESIEVENGATSITAIDAMLLVQKAGAVVPPAPITGPSAGQVWTGRASRQADSKAIDVDALRSEFNALLGRLRAAGILQPEPATR